MRIITLKRITHTQEGVFGVLLDDSNFPIAVSIELPWKSNQVDISCIPSGEFQANKITSPKRGYQVFELQNVPNRTNIEMHIANSIHDINGCVGVADSFGIVETPAGEMHGVLNSRLAFLKFMEIFKNDDSIKVVISE